MRTWFPKESSAEDTVERKWYVVDATGQKLGRLATQIATVLRGKHKAEFTPYADTGDFVVVVNAEKVEMSGNKWIEKKYYTHTRFFGSLKEKSAEQMREQNPEFLIEAAVKGMLPTNKLSRHLLNKLKTYSGPTHPHAAQKPEPLNVK